MTPTEHSDPVNHPSHYRTNSSGIETIVLAEDLGFAIGNAVKYLTRYEHKVNPLEDLLKAEWYIKRFIAQDPYRRTTYAEWEAKVVAWCNAEPNADKAYAVQLLALGVNEEAMALAVVQGMIDKLRKSQTEENP